MEVYKHEVSVYILNVVSVFFRVICFWCIPVDFVMFYTLINIIFSDRLNKNFNDGLLFSTLNNMSYHNNLKKKKKIILSLNSFNQAEHCIHHTELYV